LFADSVNPAPSFVPCCCCARTLMSEMDVNEDARPDRTDLVVSRLPCHLPN
jgi:hypothetical protein